MTPYRTCLEMTTIYVFCNGCDMADWHVGMAIASDGECVHQHVSSNHEFVLYDCGVRNKNRYDALYPDGWQIEWVEQRDIKSHAGLMQAYRRNQIESATRQANAT